MCFRRPPSDGGLPVFPAVARLQPASAPELASGKLNRATLLRGAGVPLQRSVVASWQLLRLVLASGAKLEWPRAGVETAGKAAPMYDVVRRLSDSGSLEDSRLRPRPKGPKLDPGLKFTEAPRLGA